MRVADLLTPSRVAPSLSRRDKEAVMAEMAALLAADNQDLNPDAILDALMDRESLGTTGIGNGIAIPHGKLRSLAYPLVAMGRAVEGIAFQSLDGKPVQLVMALISPTSQPESHLKALAAISRLLREPGMVERMLQAQDRDTLFRLASGGA